MRVKDSVLVCLFPVYSNVTPVLFSTAQSKKAKLLFHISSYMNLMLLCSEVMCSVKVCTSLGLILTFVLSTHLNQRLCVVPLLDFRAPPPTYSLWRLATIEILVGHWHAHAFVCQTSCCTGSRQCSDWSPVVHKNGLKWFLLSRVFSCSSHVFLVSTASIIGMHVNNEFVFTVVSSASSVSPRSLFTKPM